MRTPTQVVTHNAQAFLGDNHDVVLAMRVEWGADVKRIAKGQAAAQWASAFAPILTPLLAWTRYKATIERMRDDASAGCGILALTADEERVLLSAKPLQRKIPTGIAATLPRGSALLLDTEMMETNLVPIVTIDGYGLVVNGVDFKMLLRAVETGTVVSPDLEMALGRLQGVGRSRYD